MKTTQLPDKASGQSSSTPKETSTQTTTQTAQNPVSPPTVNSIALNAAEKTLVRRDEANKKREYLKALETDARNIVSGFQEAKGFGEQAMALHRKFKDVLEEMRPVFERVREGFAHLHKGEKVMGETTGEAWAQKHLGITYDWLCRCLNPPKAGKLLLTDGTKVVDPQAPESKQACSKPPTTDSADWTDTQYIQACVWFVEAALKPLESDPQRRVQLAEAIAAGILGEVRDGDTARHEPAVGPEREGEFAPEPPARNPWWSMTKEQKKQFAAGRLREKQAAKRADQQTIS